MVDGVAASTADADYFDYRLGLGIFLVEQERLLLIELCSSRRAVRRHVKLLPRLAIGAR
jgi:hypothetical protein